jgi:hypothetical protein
MNVVRPEQVLALRAALLVGHDALRAFAQWRDAVPFDEIDSDTLRLVPRMYQSIRSLGGDDPVLDRMKAVYLHTWASNRVRMADGQRLLAVLNDAGISSVLLKGVAVLARWTRDSGVRPMYDVDVLVHQDQARIALMRLFDAGYKSVAMRADRFSDREFRKFHAALLRSSNGIDIDLHWRALMDGPGREQDQEFWDRAEPIRFMEMATHVLSPEDHLYHTFAHAASSSNGARIDWAADAVTILREVDTKFDWDRFVSHVRRDGIGFPVRAFVDLLRHALDIPIPRNIDRQLTPAWPAFVPRLDFSLRRRSPGKLGAAARAFLAFQDFRRQSVSLCHKPVRAAVAPFILAHWQFDSIAVGMAYGLFATMGRPRRLRRILAGRVRPRLLSNRDLPDVNDFEFSVVDARRDPFIAGWSVAEPGGRWTEGREAVLALRVSDRGLRDMPVRARVTPFYGVKKELEVEVWAGGRLADVWHFSSQGPHWPYRTFAIDCGGLGQREAIEIAFVIRSPSSPAAAGDSSDFRQLGLYFQNIQFGYELRDSAFEHPFDFRAPSADTELLWYGWSLPEATGCWTDGPRAVVAMRLPYRPAGDIAIAIEAQVFAGALATISANGTHLGQIGDTSPPDRHHSFTIPHSVIEENCNLALTIDLTRLVSPFERSQSADTRKLGLHLTSLKMSI